MKKSLHMTWASLISTVILLSGCGGGNGSLGKDSENIPPPEVGSSNIEPQVSAKNEIKSYEKEKVSLIGSASDSDGSITLYSWSQISGPTVALNNANTETANFIAPSVLNEESIEFKFKAKDNDGAENSTNVVVKIYPLVNISGAILVDTVLSPDEGPYEVTSLLSVGPDVTLTVLPGTMVRFHPNTKLTVAGELIMQGTEEKPIFLSSLNSDKRWTGVELIDTKNSIMEYTLLERSYRGLNLKGISTPVIRNNIFRDNDWAITDDGGYQPMIVENNTFVNCTTAFAGIRTTENSQFSDNKFVATTNIFEWGYYFGSTIVAGNSFQTASFVIKAPEVGFGYGAVNVGNNWWGTTDVSIIEGLILDLYDDATLQEVAYLPVLNEEPVNVGSNLPANIELPSIQ